MLKQLRSFIALIFSVVTLAISTAATTGYIHQREIARQDAFSQKTPLADRSTDAYEQQVGKKLNFSDKIKIKIAQKYAKKSDKSEGSGKKILSLLALLLGLGSLVAFWYFYLLGGLMALAAVVLGIVALKKEQSKLMAILGIAFGGLTLLVALALIALASFSFS